jgi:hypothetical protein
MKVPEETEDIDFSFSDVDEEVDKLLDKREKKEKPKATVQHISEKIRTGLEIKNNLPDKGFLNVKAEEGIVTRKDENGEEVQERKIIVTHKDTKGVEHVEITDGLFNIDLRNDANWWFIRTPDVVPSMINQAVRTALDVKKCHEPEKRKIEFPYLLVIGLIVGAIIIGLMFWSLLT